MRLPHHIAGGKQTNYDSKSVTKASDTLVQAQLPKRLMIDCSHANSGKQHHRQLLVARHVASQIADGETRIMGVMLESHLVAGPPGSVFR